MITKVAISLAAITATLIIATFIVLSSSTKERVALDGTHGASQKQPTTRPQTVSSQDSVRRQTYQAKAEYPIPGNKTEGITVTITTANGTIEDVIVWSDPDNPTSKKFQKQFTEGVSTEVVGKALEDAFVGVVNGSSQTGKAFNAALSDIIAQAQ